MKSRSIAQRLYAFFTVTMLAMVAGFAGFYYADNLESQAIESQTRAESLVGRLRLDSLQTSDALRGLMLDPANRAEADRKQAADVDFTRTADSLKQLWHDQPDVLAALATVLQQDDSRLNKTEDQIIDLLRRDPTAATALYSSALAPSYREQAGLISRLVDLSAADDQAEIAHARQLRGFALAALVAIFAAAAVALFFLARSLSRPIQALNAAVGILAEGDLSVSLPAITGGDEIGQLTQSLTRLLAALRSFSDAAGRVAEGDLAAQFVPQSSRDTMGNALAEMGRRLAEFSAAANRVAAGDLTAQFVPRSERDVMGNALAEMGRRLSALIGDVQRSGVLVVTSITEIAATTKQQQSTANEVAATTTEIGATSKEISATARDLAQTVTRVNESAQQTTTLADNGREALGRMDDTMRRVSDASGAINARLTVLNDKAANIGSVVTTIAKVADQTNLLSLNAAIEAEKAGEYGRGFAVVATEIRRLADQTAAATVDIEQLVKEIQSAVTAGVMGMDKFSEEVRRGVTEVEKVAGQLTQIIQHVQAINPRIESVSEGMQAQSTGAEQISQALTQLGEAARQTAESLRQSNDTMRSLDEATRNLRAGVERFKIG